VAVHEHLWRFRHIFCKD